jgi:hypothetical protein
MAAQTEYNADGAAITDEPVKCHRSVVINATTYYFGHLMEISDDSVLGNTDADYGAWTATSKGGTRYNVLKTGVPGANECVLDKTTGRVLVTVLDTTLYFRYVGYGRLFQWFNQGPVILTHKGLLDAGGTVELTRQLLSYGGGFARAIATVEAAPSGGTLVLTLAKIAGEGSESNTITIASGEYDATTEFTARMKWQAGEHAAVSVPSQTRGAQNLTIILYPG